MNKNPTSARKKGTKSAIGSGVTGRNGITGQKQTGTAGTHLPIRPQQSKRNGKPISDEHLEEWHQDLTILHRGHWDAARRYESRNFWFGIMATIAAVISGSISGTGGISEFVTELSDPRLTRGLQLFAALFAIAAAGLAAVQTFYRSSDFAGRHKKAANKYGKLRRNLEEHIDLGLLDTADERQAFVTKILKEWEAADEESLPVPPGIFSAVKSQSEKEELIQLRQSFRF